MTAVRRAVAALASAAALASWGTGAFAALPRYPVGTVAAKFRTLAAQRPACVDAAHLPPLAIEPDAAATTREIEVLLALQATRTAADVTAIVAEAGDLVPLFLARTGLTARRAPATLALLRRALADLDAVLFARKLQLLRPRPHQVDQRVRPAIAVPRHPAFPSGHGGQARLIARLLAELLPARRVDLLAYAAQVGWRREQAGVHFASDTAAGRQLGDLVADLYLSAEPCARKWRDPARAEVSVAATRR